MRATLRYALTAKLASCAAGLVFTCVCLCGAVGIAQAPAASQVASSSSTSAALAALRQGHPQQALDSLQQAIAADPNDASANLLAATAAIALYRGDLAVSYAERAHQLEPDNWKVHTTLVTAYAMANKPQQRDAERATLRKLHDDPAIPDAHQTSGFLLDLFKVKQYRVEAVEYFKPIGKFQTYFRFVVRDTHERKVWEIAIQSDERNQASWAQAYPKQASEGQRQFQIAGDGEGVHTDYRMFSGAPAYDWIKGRVVDILNAQVAPFPGETP